MPSSDSPPPNKRRLERVLELLLIATPVVIVAVFGTFGEDPNALAAPAVHMPSPDEALLVTPADPERQATFARERELQSRPDDVNLAVEVARRHIEDARRNNEPRSLGWAEATLSRWYAADPVPTEVLLLRATIRQSRHDFGAALADLNEVLRRVPTHAQAALTRATVLSVMGRPADAKPDCDIVVAGRAHPIVGATCHAALAGLTGKANDGIALLDAALATTPPPGLAAWALGTRGELHQRNGDAALAEVDYRAALALQPGDGWTTAALADLLLDVGRGAEVPTLIGASDADNLVLRRALGRAATQRDEAFEQDLATLRARYAAAHAREDAQHLREESRFVLAFEDDPERALDVALAGWEHQHEPADVRVALEAAIAVGADARPKLAPILAHLRTTNLTDATLAKLVTQLEALR